jgi:glutamyl-tRNA synthetase
MSDVRVRFAPSPTGALHIGGVRTALYNYLFAKQHGGAFVLRIEDTDRQRYIPGAEAYILEALEWLGLHPDEGPGSYGGGAGPYRQSERKESYRQHALQLVEQGKAYYAFDTPEQLDARREEARAAGDHAWKYDHSQRHRMRNSLSLGTAETARLLKEEAPYTIRLLVPEEEQIAFEDRIRGSVSFQGRELDDKVLLKADGMPTYHLANIVDDHLMDITHVIRGEEWLPSTAHHVLLYRAFGWEEEMPEFAHLPLILKPSGQGKLSKRDGRKLGIPVFPLRWEGDSPDDSFEGFREAGFDPRAVINFLAFLGWNPGTEQEIFSLEELVEAFSLEHIGKAGARFDYDKARWYNQQYLMHTPDAELAGMLRPLLREKGHEPQRDYLEAFAGLFKERAVLLGDFWTQGYYFFEPVASYDQKALRKRWKPDLQPMLEKLAGEIADAGAFDPQDVQAILQDFMEREGLKPGGLYPFLRLALSGSLKGPGFPEMISLMGREVVARRLREAPDQFNALLNPKDHG